MKTLQYFFCSGGEGGSSAKRPIKFVPTSYLDTFPYLWTSSKRVYIHAHVPKFIPKLFRHSLEHLHRSIVSFDAMHTYAPP